MQKDGKSTFAGDASEQACIQKRQFPKDVVRRIIIYSIYPNGKTLIRHLAILCGTHVRHRFNRLIINTTWGELSSEWGEFSSECGPSCFGASFLWGELS